MSRPRSIVHSKSTSSNDNIKSFLPPISVSPEESSTMIARKRFKEDEATPNKNFPSPPPKCKQNPTTINSCAISPSNFTVLNDSVIANTQVIPLESEYKQVFVEPKRKTHKVAFSMESPVILPKHSNKIISKDDLLGSSSSGSTIMTTNQRENTDSLVTPSPLLTRSHVSGMSQISGFISDDNLDDEGPMEISQNEDTFHTLTLNNTQPPNVNLALPPISCNTLFTPRNFERYMETVVTAGSIDPIETNHFDNMFTAPKLRAHPGLMRRSRSSSPCHPLTPSNLPSRFIGKDLNKVQDWLSQISQEPKARCPRDGQPDHPKFCKLCMEGKSLAKSF